MKDHELRELIDTLTQIAKVYGQTQQLRQRISEAVVPKIKAITAELGKYRNLMEAHPEFELFMKAESKSQVRRLRAQSKKS